MTTKRTGVIGAGAMGSGIIQVFVQAGYDVVFKEQNEEIISSALQGIEKRFDKMLAKGKITQEEKDDRMSRVRGTTDLADMAQVDLVVEAAVENISVKKEIFAALDKICKPEAILATNTSCLSISEIASVTSRQDKVIGMHFFNPAPVMELVEVVKGLATSKETTAYILETARALGKSPVEVSESPGFIVNRMFDPMINEAIGILADGVASAEDIDKAMRLGANHPMGPLELGDFEGLDICLSVMENLYAETKDPKYRPHPLLRKMVRSGRLGRKTGIGFYDYR